MFEQWDEVELDLRVEATLALDDGRPPEPLLVAFDDDAPLAVVALRPFDHQGVLQALVEVLALLLPLGARRIALGLPGRARDDELGELPLDLGEVADHALLVVATATGAVREPAHLTARILPLAFDGDCWQWHEECIVDIDAEAWDITRALGVLLSDAPEGLGAATRDRGELQAQLARCLLLGHMVALAPAVADDLEPDRAEGLAPRPPLLEP